MKNRRGRGEGSITQRADGRWMARVDLGWRDGRRRYKSVYGRTRRKASEKLTKALRDVQQGIALPDERQTVAAYLHAWLEHKRARMRSRAWLTYEQAVRLHLTPGLGKFVIARLTVGQVEAWFQRHQEAGATGRTIRYARSVLRIALNHGRKAGLVVQNVAALSEPPKHRTKEIQPFTPEQARTLLGAAKGHRLGALVSVATALGLRLGEALGLRWVDVDFEGGTLAVRQSLERSGGDSIVRRQLMAAKRELAKKIAAAPARSAERRDLRKELEALRVEWRKVRTILRTAEPKSVRSRRTVRMPGVVVASLKAHRTRQLEERLAAGGDWADSGLIFTTPLGAAMDPRGATREYHALLEVAGLPSVRFHDLRHTAATLLLAQGVDPRTIMETLGHSQISLTLNTYSHVLPALQQDAADRMDSVLKSRV